MRNLLVAAVRILGFYIEPDGDYVVTMSDQEDAEQTAKDFGVPFEEAERYVAHSVRMHPRGLSEAQLQNLKDTGVRLRVPVKVFEQLLESNSLS